VTDLPGSIEAQERLHAADVAAGVRPADAALLGGRVVEVHSGRILPLDVAIAGGRIAAVGEVAHCLDASTEQIDCSGLFVLPGFVDGHFHVGGSQLAIEGLAEVLVPRGTVALSTCFYEPAVVAGPEAVEELLRRAGGGGLDILLSPFYAAAIGLGQFGNPGRFTVEDLRRFVLHPACVELREWNYAIGQLPQLSEVWQAAIARGIVVGGHLEGLRGAPLSAAVALGVRSDHETATAAEAIEKARAGVMVQVREGSGARDLEAVLRAITEHGADSRCFSFSTDEQELASLAQVGHIDHKLRLAVAHGLPPVDAVCMATLNAARSLGVERDFGAVAPGRVASLVIVEDLSGFAVRRVFSRGRLAAEDGRYLLHAHRDPYPAAWYQTVEVARDFSRDDFRLDVPDGVHDLRVIGCTPGSLLTEELVEEVEVQGGCVEGGRADLATIAVFDRHAGGGRSTVGLISGLGIERGALAATVNPGLMDLMVIGVDPDDMALAASRAVALQGGIVLACGGEILADVPLPLFGILSDAPAAEVIERCVLLERAIGEGLGSQVDGLVTGAGFACLAVSIPRLKICARGLLRVARDGHEAVDLVLAEAAAI
jgi:adenine deaminase